MRLVLLLAQQVAQMEQRPPVTLALVAGATRYYLAHPRPEKRSSQHIFGSPAALFSIW